MPPKIAKKGTKAQMDRAIANTQSDSQPDAETQVDVDTQVDANIPSSSADSNVDDTMASTADGSATSTAATTHSADETEVEPVAQRPAGKKIAAATDTKDGEGKKKRRSFQLFCLHLQRFDCPLAL